MNDSVHLVYGTDDTIIFFQLQFQLIVPFLIWAYKTVV